jgi:hypothetical protein
MKLSERGVSVAAFLDSNVVDILVLDQREHPEPARPLEFSER